MENEKSYDFQKLIQDSLQLESVEPIDSNLSKDILIESIETRLKTTMIGALSSVEEHMGFLWNFNDGIQYNEKHLTDEQRYVKDKFEELREEILDKGHEQIRQFKNDIKQYEVQANHVNHFKFSRKGQ